jgi:hypothetical protein
MLTQFDAELRHNRKRDWLLFLERDIGLDQRYAPISSVITEITDVATTEVDTTLVLKPDGAGGTVWGSDTRIPSYFTGSLTDGAPTNAEIVAILGTAASRGAGYTATIKDSDGTGLVYHIMCDGANYYYITGTQAV